MVSLSRRNSCRHSVWEGSGTQSLHRPGLRRSRRRSLTTPARGTKPASSSTVRKYLGFSRSTSMFWVKKEWNDEGDATKKATPIFVVHFLLWSPHKLSFLIPEQCFWIHLLQQMHFFFFARCLFFFSIFFLRKPNVFCFVFLFCF